MCLAPITIKNPYHGLGHIGMNAFHDTVTSHIQVPCGNCPQCIAMRQGFYLQRIQMESLRSHLYMFTLTYNDESLVYVDVGEYHYAVPHLSDIQNAFKRLRKRGLQFRVSYVSEYGKKRFRPHFHGILAVPKSSGDWRSVEKVFKQALSFEWRRNYATTYNRIGDLIPNTRNPDWRSLFTPVFDRGRCTTFDFHYIEPVRDHDNDCAFYVSKYITKYDSRTHNLLLKILQDPNLSDDETVYLYKLTKPRCNTSKDFGDWRYLAISEYINTCASRESLFRYPQYYDIYSGKQMPMSPYYGRHVIGFEHVYKRLLYSDLSEDMSTNFLDRSTILDYHQKSDSARLQFEEYKNKLKKLEKRLDI